MSNMARLVRDQVSRVMRNVRQAFRGTAARNTHGKLIGIEMEGLAGESVSGELMQHYGYSSAPLPGAEFLAIPVGGNSKHTVVVASEDGRYRITLIDGEVSLYTDEGDYAPTIRTVNATAKIELAPDFTMADVQAAAQKAYNTLLGALKPGDTLKRSQIEAMINNLAGVLDRAVTAPSGNVKASDDPAIVGWIRPGTITLGLLE